MDFHTLPSGKRMLAVVGASGRAYTFLLNTLPTAFEPGAAVYIILREVAADPLTPFTPLRVGRTEDAASSPWESLAPGGTHVGLLYESDAGKRRSIEADLVPGAGPDAG